MTSNHLAFEVTEDDVKLALGLDVVDDIYDGLDFDEITSAALCADDIEEQTSYAYEEIKRQYQELMRNKSSPSP